MCSWLLQILAGRVTQSAHLGGMHRTYSCTATVILHRTTLMHFRFTRSHICCLHRFHACDCRPQWCSSPQPLTMTQWTTKKLWMHLLRAQLLEQEGGMSQYRNCATLSTTLRGLSPPYIQLQLHLSNTGELLLC